MSKLDDLLPPPATRLGVERDLNTTLESIRRHLGMDVAFIGEFSDGRRIFRTVSGDSPAAAPAGASDPLEETFCQRVVDGRLPELIREASQHEEAVRLPVTARLPVGAHLSVPIRLKDGEVYGTFCCYSAIADHSLNDRDLAVMRVFAEMVAEQVERDRELEARRAVVEARIRGVIDTDALSTVYQPIYHVAEDRLVGFESLSRFTMPPPRAPNIWFEEAEQVGLGVALESHAIRTALRGLRRLPAELYLSVNVSPGVILGGGLAELFGGWPLGQIVLEVTEHATIDHYAELAEVMQPLRARGLRIAVDDAGAGYASFRHILNLRPDIIKLDTSITHNIDADGSKRALAAALIGFATETRSKIVAEGVETAAELTTLRGLGVNKAQGYFLGEPAPLPEFPAP